MTDSSIRIGVAGLGRAFSVMLPTFAHDPRVRLVAAADPVAAARALRSDVIEFCNAHPIPD
jgi:phthalate 4,5-cis-dihydrodiol dehydrogenase